MLLTITLIALLTAIIATTGGYWTV